MQVRFNYGNPVPVRGKIVSVRREGEGPFEKVYFTVKKRNNHMYRFVLHRVDSADRSYMAQALKAAEELLRVQSTGK